MRVTLNENKVLQQFMQSPLLLLILALTVGLAVGVAALNLESPLLPIVGLVGLAIAWRMFQQPVFGLYVLLFMTYARLSDVLIRFHGAPSVFKFFVFAILFIILFRWHVYGEKPEGWQTVTILVGVYALWLSTSLIYAEDFSRVVGKLEVFGKNALIAIIITMLLNRPNRLYYAIWMVLAAGIFMSSITVYQVLTETYDNVYWGYGQVKFASITVGSAGERIAGPIGDPNYYSQFLVFLVPLALERVWNERRGIMRLLAIWGFCTITLANVFTYSRGGFVALVIALAIMFVRRPPSPIALLATILLAISISPIIPDEYVARMDTILDAIPGLGDDSKALDEQNDGAVVGRASQMIAGYYMFTDNPLMGVGLGNYNNHYPDYSEQIGIDPNRKERSAHSLYLEIMAEQGLIGIFAFVAILYILFSNLSFASNTFQEHGSAELRDITFGIGSGLIGYLFAAIFLHQAFPQYWWLIVGLTLSLPNVAKAYVEIYAVDKPADSLSRNANPIPAQVQLDAS